MKQLLPVLALMALFLGCKEKVHSEQIVNSSSKRETEGPSSVTVTEKQGGFSLSVNGKPFFIHGAGLEFGNIKSLAEHGGNSFRTWRTGNGQQSGKEVLDEAKKNGLMVTMGLEMGSERHGFDYNDTDLVEAQKQRIREEVMSLKDHPALLIWCIGNELNLNYTNPKVWDAVNDIANMIHQIDGNHPTTTTLAGVSQREIDFVKQKCPQIDILSIQMYGDLPSLPRLLQEYQWDGPYMVTEWGATGHWEVPQTEWGAPLEENTTVKADNYLKRYQNGIAVDQEKCLGSYVFLWGNKQERTPTWYGIFLENGNETEAVDVMHYIWNGQWPANRSPKIVSFVLDGKTAQQNVHLKAGQEYASQLSLTEPDGDNLDFHWEILPESQSQGEGGDHEDRPRSVEGLFIQESGTTLKFAAPSQKGAYRLFVYANDGNNHSATANIPFYVGEN
ncbi:glycoside hydrolase family 2 TIM barrel-domain containing protein [Flagellimonas aequoris]|uniref:Glycoside hydrolase family 2 catalytic domain-containing protein n=1 Tax=Flagellimonas aequoris TaxID=2306997 RepID=A0A418N920_9FLAO|nr:glycoside hydrolase family 2 TIM barrel-domain containing protein [Allomuricauda aequoris]RIV71671.1 hypothetical protein D2U88_07065 [Allomuricauda aequoris]TXK03082.1 hypothetical protein FQ019_07010 [Allomuricauda aequoris]